MTNHPAITVHQPYASLIAAGLKTLEIKSTRINYRGPMVICAGLTINWNAINRVRDLLTNEQRVSLAKAGIDYDSANAVTIAPTGVALCVVDVIGWHPFTKVDEALAWVDFDAWDTSGASFPYPQPLKPRFAWELANVRPLRPFHVRGMPGLFKIDGKMVRAAL